MSQNIPVRWSLLLALGFVGLSGCQEQNTFVPPPPPAVTVAHPLEQPVQEYFETTGQTRAVDTVELRARVNGYLKQIAFKDGELVEQGQLLFAIDPAPYESQRQAADAAVAKAKAQLRLAQQQLARTKTLTSRQVATETSLEIQEAEQSAAAADVASAEATLRKATLDLNYTQIKAPFTGRIGRHLVDVENLVESGTTLLANLETVDPIHAYFTVSESDLLRFMNMQLEGKLKLSEADPIHIQLALGNSDNFEFDGVLDFRESRVDPETGTTERRAVFANPDGRLIPGLFVRIRAAIGDPEPRLLVEDRAIGADQRGPYVLTVNDKNVVEHRSVTLGIVRDGIRVIERGLSIGDRVVVNGVQRARPGTEVAPEEAQMGAGMDLTAFAIQPPPILDASASEVIQQTSETSTDVR